MFVNDVTVKDKRGLESKELTTADGLLYVGVCRLCVSVLGWCCSGKEGTCIFAIKLLPMHSHRGRNHHTMSVSSLVCGKIRRKQEQKNDVDPRTAMT